MAKDIKAKIHFRENASEKIIKMSKNRYTFAFKENSAKTFTHIIAESIEYLIHHHNISQLKLSNIIGLPESSLRSLKQTERKTGISFTTLCCAYILYTLKDGNEKEKYTTIFDKTDLVKDIIENIDLNFYRKELEKISLLSKNQFDNMKEDTQETKTTPNISSEDHTLAENTEKENNIPEQDNQISIINQFKKFLTKLLGYNYEFNIQHIEFNKYFIVEYTSKTKSHSETIVAIALEQEIEKKVNNPKIWKNEIKIIKENLNRADIFWFFHYQKTSKEKFYDYIEAVPEIANKTLIEAVKSYDEIGIIYSGNKAKLKKELKKKSNVTNYKYKLDLYYTVAIQSLN